jgi:hypothetical protein
MLPIYRSHAESTMPEDACSHYRGCTQLGPVHAIHDQAHRHPLRHPESKKGTSDGDIDLQLHGLQICRQRGSQSPCYEGHHFFLNSTQAMWDSHKTNIMSPSSNAAEQAAASMASHGTVWMRPLLVELGAWSADHRLPLFCDNTGAVRISNDTIGLTHRKRWIKAYYAIHFAIFSV